MLAQTKLSKINNRGTSPQARSQFKLVLLENGLLKKGFFFFFLFSDERKGEQSSHHTTHTTLTSILKKDSTLRHLVGAMLHIHFQPVMLRCTQGNKRKNEKKNQKTNSEETFPFIVSLRPHSPLPPSPASLCALLHCGRSLTEQTAAGYTVWEDGAISGEVGGASPAEGRNTSSQPTVSCDEAAQSCISSSPKDF